jgi:hypothetical protein
LLILIPGYLKQRNSLIVQAVSKQIGRLGLLTRVLLSGDFPVDVDQGRTQIP